MNYLATTVSAILASECAVVQVSGGRDSRTMLELLAPHLRQSDWVVMLLTDDAPAETAEYAAELDARFDNFKLVYSASKDNRDLYGHPSPVVLSDKPSFSDAPLTRSQFDCCHENIMLPLHFATSALEPDLIIRGQRITDEHKNPIQHLEKCDDGVVYAYPIADWTDEKVNLFLADRLPDFYQSCSDAPDCMTCTGYWGRGYQTWLEQEAPDLAAVRQERIRSLIQAITPALLLGIQEVK